MKLNLFKALTVGFTLLIGQNIVGATTYTNHYDFSKDGVFYDILTDSTVAVTYEKYYSYYFRGNLMYDIECGYNKDVIIPESVTYKDKDYSIIGIGYKAFYNAKLSSLSLPNSVKYIENQAFEDSKIEKLYINDVAKWCRIDFKNGVQNNPFGYTLKDGLYIDGIAVKDLVIPDSVTSISDYAFYDCKTLTSVVVPESVTNIGAYAFYGCNGLTSAAVPQSVASIGENAFAYCGSLWSTNCKTTQSTISVSLSNFGFKNATYKIDGYAGECNKNTVGERWAADSLQSGSTYNISCFLFFPNTGLTYLLSTEYGSTNSISFGFLSGGEANTPTSIGFKTYYKKGDAIETVVKEEVGNIGNDTTKIKKVKVGTVTTYTVFGLKPSSEYQPTYTITLNDGRTVSTKNWSYPYRINTKDLELETLQPKVVSSTCAIAAATTNISDEETNVGFQWKKYEAPESLKPSEGYTAIYDGQLEGYIKNLQPTYYNVRAFYKSSDGTYYYGDWVTFDQTDFSYFEPTVHTYEATEVTYKSAKVKGYVMQGTDDVTEQGFEYWTSSTAQASRVTVSHAPSATDDVMTVFATGQVMTVTLEGLLPNTSYTCRAFVTTANGTTYGEEQSFTTDEATGIYDVIADKSEVEIVGYYDMLGRRFSVPQKGLNIVRYSDGKAKKIFVK